MHKFRAKSNLVLGVMALMSLLAFIAVENSKVDVKQAYYEEKLAAAQLTQTAENCLKNSRLENGIFIDAVNDPNETALIGQEYSLITTDRGYIDAKLSSTNPNFAAVIVQLLKEAGVKERDYVALAFTGSFPALNLSTLAAVETLKLNPVIISSVGASNYGANDPYFTWLDMESALYEAGVFKHRSVAASIGGGFDVGRGLSPEGRNLIVEAIERNQVEFINEDHLENSIARRMELYQTHSKENPIKAFINVGGGIASLGHTVNGELIPTGLTKNLMMMNFPVRGVLIQMGQKGIPVIHLMNIKELMTEHGLPFSPVPLPEPGEGGIFVQKKYSIIVTAISAAFLFIVVVLVYFAEKKYHRLGQDVVPVKGISTPEKPDNDDSMTL